MDQRLYVAACTGDVGALLELLKEDSLILHEVTLATSNTPLHIAALLGHTEFAKLVTDRCPELLRELNQHGYSPLHLAASKGHLQIVIELVNIDKGLCLLKDYEGRTPLHCAVIKGRVDVIRQLLSCCPETAGEVTYRDENVLHLAVKNGQFEAIVSLLSIPGERNLVDELVNCVDKDGNTVWRLATARKQHRITEILLKETKVNVNAANSSAASESHNINNEEMVHSAQGQSTSVIQVPQRNEEQVLDIDSDPEPRRSHTNAIQLSPTYSKSYRRALDSIKNGIIVLCSLFASFCFEAILNPPGGLWQDWQSSNIINTTEAANEVKKYTNHLHRLNLLSFLGPLPHLNVTTPDLFGPNKAISVTVDPYHFLKFLYANAACFIASLVTIILVMITTSWESIFSALVQMMTVIIIGSAILLYQSVLALVTNTQFATWAFRIGVAQSSTAIGGYLIVLLCFKKKFWRVLGMICGKIFWLAVNCFRYVCVILRKLC